MKSLPQVVLDAWNDREPVAVLATVDKEGNPNVIYTRHVGCFEGSVFFIANHAFQKTKENIERDGRAAFLFLTTQRRAFQVKGRVEFQTEGAIFDEAAKLGEPTSPPRSVAVIRPHEVYSGAERLA